ncbi:hypothetical protein [Nocardioides sp. TF02-7]|uniref:hypothetical protein n=1 Tax=Nocardioides sp. TF02-7 TaxID=2917724 RepID=UPI001F054AAB|nr:hypothetical protein [Nocardioides sp. TF02-7]UMG93819.1 hypothetical protein MF408_06680 [Nocardioides sp. TF02-7]
MTVTTTAATTRSSVVRRSASSARNAAARRVSTTMTAIVTTDHTTRWARISTAPLGSSSGQYNGNAPHRTYAVTPSSSPVRDSFTPGA